MARRQAIRSNQQFERVTFENANGWRLVGLLHNTPRTGGMLPSARFCWPAVDLVIPYLVRSYLENVSLNSRPDSLAVLSGDQDRW